MTRITLDDAKAVAESVLEIMTPAQIDTLKAVIDQAYAGFDQCVESAWDALHRAMGDTVTRWGTWSMRRDDLEHNARAVGTSNPKTYGALTALGAAQSHILELNQGIGGRIDKEYQRRGGWTRSYLVTDGHAHSSTGCSTCNNGVRRTQFVQLVEYSGRTQEEIVAAAGERACTVCYPDAPVAKGETAPASVMLTPDEEERARAREQASAVKAEKQRRAAAGVITHTDGQPLREEQGNKGSVLKTLVSAQREMSSEAYCLLAWDLNKPASRHFGNLEHLAAAVGAKQGRDAGEILDEVIGKAVKKVASDLASARHEDRRPREIAAELQAQYTAWVSAL